ncbi:unnamed protein product [Auanema sp. JU1783]|nr:unnamed protein product [Auanema sp. JU1783]
MLSKGWVKLQIEPVEVTIDNEESLLFSTVQSIVPGAHGLYYRENGQRKALGFDTTTGRVFAPTDGWQAQDIYVHLAHGTRHGMHYADYSKATAQFEKNVSAVQKLFAGLGHTGFGGMKPIVRGEKKARSRSKVKSGFEAQPENVHISEESDIVSQPTQQDSIEILRNQLKEIQKENEDLKKRDQRVSINAELEVEKLKARNSELESKLANFSDVVQSQEISASNISVGSVEAADDSKQLSGKLVEKDEEINNLHNVIEELREQLGNRKKAHLNLQNELDQNKDLLKNARDKISYLENQLNILSPGEVSIQVPKSRSRNTSESHEDAPSKIRALDVKLQMANNQLRIVESDKQKLQEANWFANERVSKLEKDIGYLKGANDEMRHRLNESTNAAILAEKDQRIYELAEQRSKLEWRLGELNQWWNDSKWKVGELESSLAHQKYLLETAGNKIQNLNEHCPQAAPQCTATYAIRQDQPGYWQLANSQFPAVFSQQQVIPNFNSYSIPVHNTFGYPTVSHADSRRVTLEIENNEQSEVFVLSSFLNWQCAVRCDVNREGKTGVVLDLPRGKHEFRFLKNGSWTTSPLYSAIPNGFGGFNNLVIVE